MIKNLKFIKISLILILFIIIGVGIKCYGFSLQQEKENLEITINENNIKIEKINRIQNALHETAEALRDYDNDNYLITGLSNEWKVLNEQKLWLLSDNEKFTNRIIEINKEEASKKYMGEFTLYAYSGHGITSTGTKPKINYTIAVDPKIIPYGSKVYIEGYGTYIAEDCGGAIKGNKIDIFMSSNAECNKFGVRKAKVYIIK